jgi:hypothetical protein
LIACWAIVWVGFFSLSATKLPSYVLPAYPALALMTALLIHGWVTQSEVIHRGWLRAAFGILAFVGLAIVLAMPIVAKVFLARDLLLGLFGLAPLCGGVVALYFAERDQPRRAATTLAVTAVAFITGLFGFAVLRVDKFQNSEMFAGLIHESSSTSRPHVAQYDYARPSVVFYTRQHVKACQTPEQVGDFFRQHAEDAFLLTPEDQLSQLATVLPKGVSVLERSPSFLRKGQIVLLGRPSGAAPESADKVSKSPQQARRRSQTKHQ